MAETASEAERTGGILVYGATGLTGKLIAGRLKQLGLPATLAGRNADKLEKLHQELQLPVEAFELTDRERLGEVVGRHKVVLHVAGPYTETSEPMVQACLQQRTHYLDITGELGVVRRIHEEHGEKAAELGITLMPAIGFDIIPGDCLAAYLHSKLPSATHLHIGTFLRPSNGPARVSYGTMLSGVLYMLGHGGVIVKDGTLQKDKIAKHRRRMAVKEGSPSLPVMSFPCIEMYAAKINTSIPNIIGYVPGADSVFSAIGYRVIASAARTWPFKALLRRAIIASKLPQEEPEGDHGVMFASGEAIDERTGESVRASVGVSEGYKFTACASVEIAKRVMEGRFKPGFQTASSAYGWEIIEQLEEVIPIANLT